MILWNNATEVRDLLYRTTNGGLNWMYQIPDTSMQYKNLTYIYFTDNLKGWSYALSPYGVHTTTGGNAVFYTGIEDKKNNVPKDYVLFHNYPNPFNPKTFINYEIHKPGYVKVLIFDINGKLAENILDKRQNAGKYTLDFSGNNYSSGIYFYSLYVDGTLVDTKKMVLIKL